MSYTLTIKVEASTEAEAVSKARGIAATWFGTACLAAGIRSVTTTTTTEELFTAEVDVEVHHRIERPSYGFPYCATCKLKMTP